MNVDGGSSSHVTLDFYNLRSSAGSENHVNERLRNFSTTELSEREKKLEIQLRFGLDHPSRTPLPPSPWLGLVTGAMLEKLAGDA